MESNRVTEAEEALETEIERYKDCVVGPCSDTELLLVQVGNDHFPSTDENVAEIQELLDSALNGKPEVKDLTVLVTHHAVNILRVWIPQPGRSILHLKVGTDESPATQEDITEWQDKFQKKRPEILAAKGQKIWWAVPHWIEIEVIHH